jgi:uncharacterized membrane-anchored protein
MSSKAMTTPEEARPLNRVPAVTVDFWAIKLLAVTMGETAADYLAVNLGFGLSLTSLIMCAVLTVALAAQFRQGRYRPWAYWMAVVLISIVGTLVSDNLVDNLGVKLETTAIGFGILLLVVFAAWFLLERTLSIHTIFTARREAFYWLAILFTFALGTAVGDLVAEQFDIGYLTTAFLFLGLILVIAAAYYILNIDGILAFWLAYIFTRPLGASFGDLLAQPPEYGGIGFGTTITSVIFLTVIALLVAFMTITRRGDENVETGRAG